MRYDFPDRTNDPKLCHDYTIGRNVAFPQAVTEVWISLWAKFDATFTTVVPNNACQGISSSGYKFVFGRVFPSAGRFNLIVGMNGVSNTWGYPDNDQAWEYGMPPKASQFFDGKWHEWRFHLKVGPAGIAIFGLDGQVDKAFTNVLINRTGITGIGLGRNMNQGPVHPQSLSWGAISVWRSDPGWGW